MADVQIDLAAISAEVEKMDKDSIAAELLKLRTRQKVQQKKNQGSETQKKYQAKQREKQKLLKAKAMELGLWDNINEQAEAAAEKAMEAEAAEAVEPEQEA
jgi:hypothetical protein